MISVDEQERRVYLDWLNQGKLLDSIQLAQIQRHKTRQYDGFIHAGKLDWSKSPEQQWKGILNPGNYSVPHVLKTSRAGEMYHEDLQKMLDVHFGTQHAYKEFAMEIVPYRFRGTCDRLQLNTPIGNILFEFKTDQTYEKDSTWGNHIKDKLERLLEREFKRDRKTDIEAKYHLFTDKEVEELFTRVMSRPKALKPMNNHLTQLFSYAWVQQTFYNIRIDWAVLVYAKRDTYDLHEFAYPISQHQDMITKAYHNFYGVYQCLLKHHQING